MGRDDLRGASLDFLGTKFFSIFISFVQGFAKSPLIVFLQIEGFSGHHIRTIGLTLNIPNAGATHNGGKNESIDQEMFHDGKSLDEYENDLKG